MQVVKHSIKRMTEELHEVRINGNARPLVVGVEYFYQEAGRTYNAVMSIASSSSASPIIQAVVRKNSIRGFPTLM